MIWLDDVFKTIFPQIFHFLSKNSRENCRFFGVKTRENVVVLDFLADDKNSSLFSREKLSKKILGEKLVKMLGFCQNWIFGQKFDFSNSVTFYDYFVEIGYFWSGVKPWSVRVNECPWTVHLYIVLLFFFLSKKFLGGHDSQQLTYLRVNSRLDYYFSKWLSILAKNLSWNIFLVRICSGRN